MGPTYCEERYVSLIPRCNQQDFESVDAAASASIWLAGALQASSPEIGTAAQRTKELWDNWRSVSAQQRKSLPLDENDILQHQMSQMQAGMPGRRITSMEYGR